MQDPALAEKLQQLQKRFEQRLRDTVTEIESWSDKDRIGELLEIVHKLAGTAGTYGFSQLSTEMREFEAQLRNVMVQEVSAKERLALYRKATTIITSAFQ